MQTRDFYHGTNGDNILQIIKFGLIKPNAAGKIFFSQWRFDSVLMHGPDTKRKASFAVKLRVTIPTAAIVNPEATPGVSDTFVVTTAAPLQVVVLELYERGAGSGTVKTIRGIQDITKHLSS